MDMAQRSLAAIAFAKCHLMVFDLLKQTSLRQYCSIFTVPFRGQLPRLNYNIFCMRYGLKLNGIKASVDIHD